jgi:hypothetical protein
MKRARAALLTASACLALAACAPARDGGPPEQAVQAAQAIAPAGVSVLHIDPAQSLIVATVRRGGPLARLGHDHVVASHAVEGWVAPAAGRAAFSFRLDTLAVDEASLREQARLASHPSEQAIAGTRTNMLTRVLDAERYPVVTLAAQGQPLSQGIGKVPLTLTVTLHGISRSMPVEAEVAWTALPRDQAALAASGTLQLRQSDFGITPMAILGGALRVEDLMELRYRIVAK